MKKPWQHLMTLMPVFLLTNLVDFKPVIAQTSQTSIEEIRDTKLAENVLASSKSEKLLADNSAIFTNNSLHALSEANNTSEMLENSMAQVTSVSQLSDVQPTDWAFQALQSLVERYGVIVGYPDGTFAVIVL